MSRSFEHKLNAAQKAVIQFFVYSYNKCIQITLRVDALEVFRITNPVK